MAAALAMRAPHLAPLRVRAIRFARAAAPVPGSTQARRTVKVHEMAAGIGLRQLAPATDLPAP